MKKVILIIVIFLLIVGCSKEKDGEEINVKEDIFKVEKVDNKKELVYFNSYKEVMIEGDYYVMKYPVINIKGEAVDNINLELKSFLLNAVNDAVILDGRLAEGLVVNYDYYISDSYISIVQKYYKYINGISGEVEDNVYVFSLKEGKVVDNKGILEDFNMTEEDLYSKLENIVQTDDIAFTLMNIKDIGYYLYVNNEDKLAIIFYEVTNDEEIRKELVLN